MATAVSSRHMHGTHDIGSSSSSFVSSSSSPERSRSTSSSSTIHPLDSTESKEEKASSSVSSSPTYQSHSSSSNHKTISTAVSSTTTTGSLSPPAAHTSQKRLSKIAPLTPANDSTTEQRENGYLWDPEDLRQRSRRDRQAQSPSEQELMPSRRQKDNDWSYEQFDEEDRSYSPFADEAMPMHYPPISEEEKEARAIQLNLERWASQERERRKALRTSKTASMMVTPSAPPNRLTKRLSALNILGPKSVISPTYARDPRMNIVRNNSDKYDAAPADSPTTPQESFPSRKQVNGKGTIEREDDDYIARGVGKGKGKENSNPFSDPEVQSPASNSPTHRKSVKPTPRAPIVTPGKAPTIRHRALINALNSGGTGRMPSIVATDADEEKEAIRQIQELSIDPFQTATEVDQQRQYVMARDAARKTLLEGDEGAHIISPPPPIMASHRKSTSSSKFNEIGLNDDEDSADTSDWIPRQDYQQEIQPIPTQDSRSWWVQLFCGCTNINHDDDEEQSGRTFPE